MTHQCVCGVVDVWLFGARMRDPAKRGAFIFRGCDDASFFIFCGAAVNGNATPGPLSLRGWPSLQACMTHQCVCGVVDVWLFGARMRDPAKRGAFIFRGCDDASFFIFCGAAVNGNATPGPLSLRGWPSLQAS